MGDPGGRHRGRREAEEEQLDPVTQGLPSGDPARVAAAAQRGLEGEAVSSPHVLADPLQRQPAGLDGGQIRAERTEPGRDEVGVDEERAVRLVRQELDGERGLAGPRSARR